jgi:hypothetical protein
VLTLALGLLAAALVGNTLGRGGREAEPGVDEVASRAVAAPTLAPTATAEPTPASAEAAVPAAAAVTPTVAPTLPPTAEPTTAPTAQPTVAPTAPPVAAPPPAPADPAPEPVAPEVAAPPPVTRGRVALDDDAFLGGFSAPRNYRGRTARWLYGALSPYGEMSASFTLDGNPGAGELTIKGLDSENGGKTPIAVLLNGTPIYNGGNPLPKDTWRGPVAPWGEAAIPFPSGVLRAGRNTLTFKNLVPVSNYNAPPYFMLDEAIVTH